nr:hypothetical protein CFP56_19628 [Quercus suber]
MPRITPPQRNTATCWVRGSVMRGTLSAREMVANASTPSGKTSQLTHAQPEGKAVRTHGRHNLRLYSKLAGEATSNIADPALAVLLHVWDFPDVIEHVSAGEEQDKDQADRSPEIAILDDRQDVGRGDREESHTSEDRSGHHCDLDIVDRSNERWVRTTRQVSGDPSMNWLGGYRAGICVSVHTVVSWVVSFDLNVPGAEVESLRRRI